MATVRDATAADAALISRITKAAWTGRVNPNSSAFRETEVQIADDLAEGGGCVLLVDGEPAGSVRWSPVAGAWEVRRMGVLPAFRGRGHALRLMDAVVSRARQQGIAELRLAVRRDQPRLLDLYAGMGYAPAPGVEYMHANPGSPLWVMRRKLGA